MKGYNGRLKRLNRTIAEPGRITLTADYTSGRDAGLPLDAELQDAERVKILNGSTLLLDWLPAALWLAL